jgi:tetratricopeptide (TPR) repeat protein
LEPKKIRQHSCLSRCFSSKEAAEILGVTTRRLQSWRRRQLLPPGLSGSDQDSYSFADVVCLKAAERLVSSGVGKDTVRRLLEKLQGRVLDLDDRLNHCSVSVFGDRVAVTRKTYFLDSRAGRPLARVDLDELIERVTRCIERRVPTKSADEWFEEGRKHSRGDASTDLALAAFREALRLDPNRADAYLHIASIYRRQGKLLDAERSLRLALQRRPYSRDALYSLGTVMEDLNCLDDAIGFYERALDADPLLKDAHYRLGQACAKTQQWDRALRHWNRYLALDAGAPRAERVRRQIQQVEQELTTGLAGRTT